MRKYSLALLLLPACLVYACGGGDDSAGTDDGGPGGSEGGNTVDGTVFPGQDGSVFGVDGSTFGKDSGSADGGTKDGSVDGGKDANDGAVVFDGNYPYPLPDGAAAVIQFAGAGTNLNPDYQFLDGVQWVPQFGAVLVSDAELQGTGTLYKYSIDAGAPVVLPGYVGKHPIGNGLLADAGFFTGSEDGTLFFSPIDGGPPFVFSPGFNNKRFNQPNDVVVRNDGFVYATDPDYSGPQALASTAVFLIRPDAGVSTVVGPNVGNAKYNGIAFSPDQKLLYVSVTNDTFASTGTILKYTVNADGSLTPLGQFITADGGTATRSGGVDGLTVDDAGNVYVAVSGGVELYNAAGAFIGFITLTNRNVSSLAFGGADRRTLFIAANDTAGQDGKSALYRIYMNVAGGVTK